MASDDTVVVGICGGIASGKSNLAFLLETRGFSVLYADQIAHRSYAPGTRCFKDIVEAFGDGVVADDGSINRKELGARVFAPDRSRLDELNAIVWPATRALMEAEVATLRAAGVPTVFVEAAVLLEAGWDSMCDLVWVATAPEEVRLARLMARNSLSRDDALARLRSQMPDADRIAKASTVIDTDGPYDATERQLSAAIAAAGLRAGTLNSKPSDEEIWHVDEKNNVVGAVSRSRMRAENLWHRATYILVEDSQQRLYVQLRTLQKDYCPGHYDAVTGGVVAAGEEYAESAARELEEELGIYNRPLAFLFTFPFEDRQSKVWGGAFYCQYDGEVVCQPEEVQRVEMMSLDDIDTHVLKGTKTFTPDSLHFLELYKGYVDRKGHPASTVYRDALASHSRKRMVRSIPRIMGLAAVGLLFGSLIQRSML